MNGVNCFECCNSFLRFVTCGMLGSNDLASEEPVRLMAVRTVNQDHSGPLPPLEDPDPYMHLADRNVVGTSPWEDCSGHLVDIFHIT